MLQFAAFSSLLMLSLNSSIVKADRLLIERNARPLLAEGSFEALASWETPVEGFFVRSHHNMLPASGDDSWKVSFGGLVAEPRSFTVKELKGRKAVSFHGVLECSGNGRGLFNPPVSGIQWNRGAVGNAEWTGVSLAEIFKELKVNPEAVYVTVEGFDEPVMKSDAKFVRSIPLKMLLENNAILAWNMNREPMPVAHGGPVRLVIPRIYGQNWVKWVNKLTFVKEPDQRSYAKKAYRIPDKAVKPGDAWDPVKQGVPIEYLKVQTLFTSHQSGAKILPGPTVIVGKAFTGKGDVTKVEISLDRGTTWLPSKLSAKKDYAWQEFQFEFNVTEGATYEILARATDSEGNVQPMEQEWNPKGYLYNAVEHLSISGDSSGAILAEGEALADTHCQTCHSVAMAEGQRLTKAEWSKTIKKMADYGLVLETSQADKIASYYAAKFPVGKPQDDGRRIDLGLDTAEFANPGMMPKGNSLRGGKLFKSSCASCHGAAGEGKVGPVLKGRALSSSLFWSTVLNGKRAMPSFKDRLSAGQLADLRAWTQEPAKKL
jgi:sulfite oxidase